MEDQVITSTTEPTIVESANTSAENTAGLSQVIDQATPMDSNTTYSNLPKTDYQPAKSTMQNLINDAVHKEQTVNQDINAGKAMNSFLTQGYDYDKNEAGSYWVAGAINDNNTQMSFLQTLINEEMYDEMDLQKYYYDTNLATARAYAAQKGKETAYGFYRAAQERALAEGELTGWYMPAEGRYLLGQYTVAQNTLENPDATPEEISKANRVAKAAESWFSANQITTRGIKCLAMMNYEENVRHNTVMGELQKQANDIARQGAAASAASAQLQLRELKFQVEEMELQSGYDYSNAIGLDNDNYIGHKREDYQGLQALKGYDSVQQMLENDSSSYAAVLGATSKKWVDNILGDKAPEAYKRYYNDQSLAGFKTSISEDGSITAKSGGFTSTGKKTGDGKEVMYTVVGNEVVVGYFDDGVWMPITDENATFSDDKSIKTYIENSFGKGSMNTKGVNSVTIDGETYTFGRGETATKKNSYTNMVNSNWEKFGVNNWDYGNWDKINKKAKESETVKGTKDKDGNTVRNLTYRPDLMDEKNINEYIIFSAEDAEGNTQYYSVESDGELKKIDSTGIKEVGTVKDNLKVGDKIESGVDLNKDNARERIGKCSWIVGYDKDSNETYMALPHSDGSVEYYKVSGKVTNGTIENAKVTAINLSEKDITNAGFTSITKPNSEVSQDTDYNANLNTEKLDAKDIKISGQVTGNTDGNKGTTTYNPEDREAVFKKYAISPIERREYMDILDPKDLEKKIQSRYNNVLGMGGDQNGK